jgi:hypothetical protein
MEQINTIAPLLIGPGAAVIVLMVVLYGLYSLAIKHLIPLASALAERHLAQIDALIQAQQEEGKAVAKALSTIDKRLAYIEAKMHGDTNTGAQDGPSSSRR